MLKLPSPIRDKSLDPHLNGCGVLVPGLIWGPLVPGPGGGPLVPGPRGGGGLSIPRSEPPVKRQFENITFPHSTVCGR